MALTADDRFAITDLINLHGHYTDAGDFDRGPDVFTPDVEYDVTDLGGGVIHGLDAAREAGLALGDGNPVAHHVTNIVLTEAADGVVHAVSKGLGISTDGTANSVTYTDVVHRTPSGWRISRRTVRARRRPLHA
jgi:hypothetical protein